MVCFAISTSDGFKAQGLVAKSASHIPRKHISKDNYPQIEHLILSTIAIHTVTSMQAVMHY